MTEIKIQFLSQQKYDELVQELHELKHTKIPEIAKRIDDAKQMGDLSENAEYHEAREELSWAQSRVKEINSILDNYEIIGSSTPVSARAVSKIGSTVTVKIDGTEKEYMIVGAQEADPTQGKISNESPLGEAILGKEVGDNIKVKVPAGNQEYMIISIT